MLGKRDAEIEELVCYGLGNFHSSTRSLIQLSLCLLLSEITSVSTAPLFGNYILFIHSLSAAETFLFLRPNFVRLGEESASVEERH
jgi:hypothetical protein